MIIDPTTISSQPSTSMRHWLFDVDRPNVTKAEVARALGISCDQVDRLLETGCFLSATISTPGCRRQEIRILRTSVEGYYVRQIQKQLGPIPPEIDPKALWWAGELAKAERRAK